MSVANHLKIISTFDRWAHGRDPIGDLLHIALDYLRLEVADALALRLYHLNENGVQLGAATEDKTSTQTLTILTDESTYREALAGRQPVFDSHRKVWISPLNSEITTFGVLEIPVSNEQQSEIELRSDWVLILGEYLGQALDTRKLQDLVRIQALTSSHLTEAATYNDIAGILAKHLLMEKQFLSINLFDFNSAGQVTGFRVAVTANRKQVYSNDSERVDIDTSRWEFPISRILIDARPYRIPRVASHETLDDTLKTWLEARQITSLAIFPMRSQGQVFGFIGINSTYAPLYITESELTIYQSLVDQVSTLIRLGRVFEQADYTLAISERQKQAFNELVAGQGYADMLRIIARHMLPEGGRYLGIAELIYDSSSKLASWHIMATANRSRSFEWSKEATPITLQQLTPSAFNAIQDGEVILVEDNGTGEAAKRVGEPMVKWLRQDGTRTYASFPIMLDDRPIALLLALSRNERAFTREEINAFTNIAGQMGVLVQVRYLLDQARTARTLVENLVLANRLVMAAGNYGYMAQSITYTVARGMTAAVVTLFDHPLAATGAPDHRYIVGMSTADDIIPVDNTRPFVDIPDDPMLNRLRGGQAVIAENLHQNHGYFSQDTWELYTEIGATWAASFGLRSGDFLIGTLDILSDRLQILTSEEVDTYTTLADQIGVTIRSRQLNAQSQESQAVASRLVQTNLQVSTAENFAEMAQAVIRNLPDDIEAAVIMLYDMPVSSGMIPSSVKLQVLATRDQIIEPEIIDIVGGPEALAQSTALQVLLGDDLLIVENSRTFPFPIMGNAVEFMRSQGLFSFIASGLHSGGPATGLIALAARDFNALNRLQTDNLRAIASQVAVAVENRLLVNQTADALGFVALQYEVSNALYRAQEPSKMLAALFQFVRDYYHQARLGVIDPGKELARIIVEMDHSGDYTFVPRRTGALSTTPLTTEVLSKEPIIVGDDGRSLTLPLMSTDNQLIGVVQFINPYEPVKLPTNQIRALRSLADQMTTSLQNRFLLQQMEEGLKETRALYQAISALLSSDDTLQMLEVLYDLVADDADSIALVSLGYDVITDEIISMRLEGLITVQGAEPLGKELAEQFGLQRMHDYKASWGPQISLIEYAENPDQIRLATPVIEYFALLPTPVEVRSNITIPVIEDGMLVQLVTISYSQQRIFDHATRRLFNAIRDQLSIVMQNQRLIRDTRTSAARLGSQVRVLQTLNQLSINLSSAQDETTLMDAACRAFYNALRLDHVGISLLNPDGASATVVSDYPSHNMVGLILEDTNELQVQIRNSRTPIYLPEIVSAPGLAEASRQELSRIGIHTMLLLPLLDSSDGYLGAAGLEFTQPGREFTGEMIDIGRNIAAQTAVALQSIREVQKTKRQAGQLQRLARFSQTLQAQLDVTSILDTLVAEAPAVLPVDHLSILFFDSAAGKLRLALQLNNGQVFRLTRSGTPINDGTTAGRAWALNDFLLINNLRQYEELVHTFNSQMQSVMVGPMLVRGVPLGLIEVSSASPYAYTDTDLIVFRQMVSLVGVAQENAETYTQSQRLARSKALVNEISNRIQQQTDLSAIMDVTVGELGRALGARRARVRLGQQTNENGEQDMEQW